MVWIFAEPSVEALLKVPEANVLTDRKSWSLSTNVEASSVFECAQTKTAGNHDVGHSHHPI
jgi:hypothetical protein